MNCPECSKELAHYLRSACTPIAGLSELIRKNATKLYTVTDDSERERIINLITTTVNMMTGSVYKFESVIFEMETKGLDGFLTQQKAAYQEEKNEQKKSRVDI